MCFWIAWQCNCYLSWVCLEDILSHGPLLSHALNPNLSTFNSPAVVIMITLVKTNTCTYYTDYISQTILLQVFQKIRRCRITIDETFWLSVQLKFFYHFMNIAGKHERNQCTAKGKQHGLGYSEFVTEICTCKYISYIFATYHISQGKLAWYEIVKKSGMQKTKQSLEFTVSQWFSVVMIYIMRAGISIIMHLSCV